MSEEIAKSPDLQAACRRIIEIKLENHWKRSGFMSFGLVQLGQAATSLGENELAYECLKHLVNRFWLANMASMHNHRSLFNMDISGGMPAVLLKMLVASDPGRIQLLPAIPAAWPTGTIEGVLCRGQIEIKRLQWDQNSISVNLISARKQTIILETPSDINKLSVVKGKVSAREADKKTSRRISLPEKQEVILKMELKPFAE
jgi:hypothetical protein